MASDLVSCPSLPPPLLESHRASLTAVCSKRSGTLESSPVCRASPLQQSLLRSFCRWWWNMMMGAYGTAAARAYSPLLVVLVLVASAEGGVGPSANKSFCTESKECLEYQLLCKTDEYEVRHYSPTRWVSTDAEAYFMGVGAAMAFRRLFQYITGANQEGVQMGMTTPVLVKIPEETKMWEPAIYTLNFPLPAAYQERPPKPTNDKLYFTEMPDLDIYVRSYGGWMLSVTSRLHAHLLTKELDRVRASYNHTYHYGVGYDSPLKLTNRHNEVWYIAEGEPVCTDPQEPTPAHTPRPTPTALSGAPTGAPFVAALRALRHSPGAAAAAAMPSNQALDAPTSASASTVVPSSAVPAVSSLNLPAQSPSPVAHEAVFSLPLTSAQSPAEPSTNSSVSPSPEPQTVSGAQNVTDFQTVTGLDTVTGPQNVSELQAVTGPQNINGPQNISELQAVTGPQNVSELHTTTGPQNVSELHPVTGPQNISESYTTAGPQNINGPQNVSESHTVTGPQNVSESYTTTGPQNISGPQNVSESHAVTGPQNVSESQAVTGLADALTGPQNVSDLQTATGPQNARDARAVTAPQNTTGSQIDGELAYDSGPWNDTTAQGGPPEAQGDVDLAAMRSDAH